MIASLPNASATQKSFTEFFKFPWNLVNRPASRPLLAVIRRNRLKIKPNCRIEGLKMKKLIAALVAGLFSLSAFAAAHTAAPAAPAAPATPAVAATPAAPAAAAPTTKKAKKAAKKHKKAKAMPAAAAK
jgi:hypothetical protein